MSTSFHMGEFGKLGCCLALGDKDRDASEFRASKQGLQILNTCKKIGLLRREAEYHLAA